MRRAGLVVKMQQGEFVDLEQVSAAIEQSPIVSNAFVHAECSQCAPVCVVCLDSLALKGKIDDALVAKLKEQ